MHKAFLLLRDNKETGPYSLQEIVALGLKPFDLIWVEGKSAGWRYPTEVEMLKPYAPAQLEPVLKENNIDEVIPDNNVTARIKVEDKPEMEKTIASKHIFVRLPGNVPSRKIKEPIKQHEPVSENKYSDHSYKEIEKHANELFQESSIKIKEKQEVKIEKKYDRPLNAVESDYTDWVFKTKSGSSLKKGRRKKIFIGIASALIAAAALFFLLKQPTTQGTQLASEQIGIIHSEVKSNGSLLINNEDTSGRSNYKQNSKPEKVRQTPYSPIKKSMQSTSKTPFKRKVIKSNVKNTITKKISPETRSVPIVVQNKSTNTAQLPSEKSEVVARVAKPVEKKKGFGNAIDNLFAKLKRPKQQEDAEPQTTARIPSQMSGGRMARRRGDEGAANGAERKETVPETPLPSADMVEIEGNNKSDNFQIGIYNLKVTLHNHNRQNIENAFVDVLYFDENDQLLEKKRLNYRNVPARGSLTVKAPDQKWADHTEYSLVDIR